MKKLLVFLLVGLMLLAVTGCGGTKQPITDDEDVIVVDGASGNSTNSTGKTEKGETESDTAQGDTTNQNDNTTQNNGTTPNQNNNTPNNNTPAAEGQGPVPTTAGKIIDDKDSADALTLNKITLSSCRWNSSDDGAFNGGSNSWVYGTGQNYQFKFKGTQFQIYSDADYFFGIADVYVDNVKVGTFDQYATGTVRQNLLYTSKVLSDGEHTVKIQLSGKANNEANISASAGPCMSLDYVKVY